MLEASGFRCGQWSSSLTTSAVVVSECVAETRPVNDEARIVKKTYVSFLRVFGFQPCSPLLSQVGFSLTHAGKRRRDRASRRCPEKQPPQPLPPPQQQLQLQQLTASQARIWVESTPLWTLVTILAAAWQRQQLLLPLRVTLLGNLLQLRHTTPLLLLPLSLGLSSITTFYSSSMKLP
jgi:hypothetical protein